MKNYLIWIIISMGLLSVVASCENLDISEIPKLSNEESVLFPNTEFLPIIKIDQRNQQFPVFDLSYIQSKNVYIAVFKEKIKLDDQKREIINLDDIIWSWNSQSRNDYSVKIGYEQGQFSANQQDASRSSLNCFYIEDPRRTFYWACWAWDEDGRYVTHSQTGAFQLNPPSNTVQVFNFKMIEDANRDQLINKGERIGLSINLVNIGGDTLEDCKSNLFKKFYS